MRLFAANNTEFGLQAGVFIQSIDLAMAVAEKLHVGAVMSNEASDVRIDSMPFGGFKKLGVCVARRRHPRRRGNPSMSGFTAGVLPTIDTLAPAVA
jgi:acyl-CoA reductase-like NAD-dependent aldehyde dehydrogenase